MNVVAFAIYMLALAAPATPADGPTGMAAAIAGAMQELLPQRYEGGVSMVSVTSEREVLVVRFDVPELTEVHWEELRGGFAEGFCEDGVGASLFEQGLRVRIDASVAGGEPRRGPLIDRCPAATQAKNR